MQWLAARSTAVAIVDAAAIDKRPLGIEHVHLGRNLEMQPPGQLPAFVREERQSQPLLLRIGPHGLQRLAGVRVDRDQLDNWLA